MSVGRNVKEGQRVKGERKYRKGWVGSQELGNTMVENRKVRGWTVFTIGTELSLKKEEHDWKSDTLRLPLLV